MYVYIYIYIYIRTYVYIYTYVCLCYISLSLYIYIYIYTYVYKYMYMCVACTRSHVAPLRSVCIVSWCMRGRRNTVEIVLFEMLISMKLYPSVVHACASKARPVIGFPSQTLSMRLPSVFGQPLSAARPPMLFSLQYQRSRTDRAYWYCTY